MQDSGGAVDWAHGITGLLGAAFGAASGFVASIWRVARIEPNIRADFEKNLNAAERRVEEKIEDMVRHFHEYFEGIRRQQDDLKLATEQHFVRKDDFKEFREELRETLRDIKTAIERGQK